MGKVNKSFEIDVKRFYMPGVVVKDVCKDCGGEAVIELDEIYLSYPTANALVDVKLHCAACGDWTTEVQRYLSVTLTKVKT